MTDDGTDNRNKDGVIRCTGGFIWSYNNPGNGSPGSIGWYTGYVGDSNNYDPDAMRIKLERITNKEKIFISRLVE